MSAPNFGDDLFQLNVSGRTKTPYFFLECEYIRNDLPRLYRIAKNVTRGLFRRKGKIYTHYNKPRYQLKSTYFVFEARNRGYVG